ncbi:DMT family transporter [Pararhizobium sp. IMCC21322]|uniref:DMT family transporter n=1 Tax=Pararhizobium sp. IMCC21322 TaxID=3067903 RepID=UPI002740956A|nr:DMT family transporter [Pararhizobium sp. IMCC21322]
MPEPQTLGATQSENLKAGVWLIADMSLNIWAISIVKTLGGGYPSWQIVFLRALVGLLLLLPWVWRERQAFAKIKHWGLQILRIALSTVTLTASFFAVARLPLALFMTMNFTRPLVLIAMAAFVLGEKVPLVRWAAGAVGLIGILIALSPDNVPWSWGLLAVTITVFSGTAAIIVTRKLKGTPAVVMMAFYTAGLALLTALPASQTWVFIAPNHLPFLLAVGVFSQCAQFCFLQAHWKGDAGFLGPLGYSSLIISGTVGFLVFNEVPTLNTIIGATIIVLATTLLSFQSKH